MSLDIADALERGFRRATGRDGLLLVAITYVLGVLRGGLGTGQTERLLPADTPVRIQPRPLLEIPLVLDAVLSLLVGVATVLVTIAALRVFVSEERETLSLDLFTRNGLWAFLNFLAGGIVFGVAVVVGFLLLVIPGLILLVSLIFWDVYVAVEDDSFLEGFKRSWGLASGNRLALLGLGVVYVLISIAVSIALGIPAFLLGPLGVFLTTLGNAALTVFGSAVLASAYLQLAGEDGPEPSPETP